MTRVSCRACGGESLHLEGDTVIVCDCCGAKSFVISVEAVTKMDYPMAGDNIVTISYDRIENFRPSGGVRLNNQKCTGVEQCNVFKSTQ